MENIEQKYDEVAFLTNDCCNFVTLEMLIDTYLGYPIRFIIAIYQMNTKKTELTHL